MSKLSWLLLLFFTGSFRFIARDLLIRINNLNVSSTNIVPKRVALYGAGVGGAQLAASLRLAGSYKIEIFIN